MPKGKRPSLLASMNIVDEAGEGAAAPVDTLEVLTAPKPQAKPKPVQSTLYLPPHVHQKLREIAFTTDCKMHDLFIEGIDHVLKSKGYPTVAELSENK